VSGYLQRLALSVIKPEQNIRPIRAPVFFQPKSPLDADPPLRPDEPLPVSAGDLEAQPEIVTSSTFTRPPPAIFRPPVRSGPVPEMLAPRLVAAEPETLAGQAPIVPPSHSPTVDESGEQRQMPAAGAVAGQSSRAPAAPTLANTARLVSAEDVSGQDQPAPAGKTTRPEPFQVPLAVPRPPALAPAVKPADHAPEDQPASPHSPGPIPRETVASRPAAAPVAALLVPTAASHAPSAPATAWGLKKQLPTSGRSQRPELPTRVQDEIEIHIGRIEVIAVPPPKAPPTPAKPARTGPSLEAYLRRRDRRSL
jgi:hypothetical protein